MPHKRFLLALLASLAAPSPTMAEQLPAATGWHTWRSAAIEGGASGCCYRWSSGNSAQGTCRLTDDGMETAETTLSIAMPSGRPTNEIQVFARLSKGEIVAAQALSTNCPVEVDVELEDLGQIEANTSINWLSASYRDGRDPDDHLLHVLSQHRGGDGALIRLIENQELEDSERKAALFWLANTASESAVAWFDDVLGE